MIDYIPHPKLESQIQISSQENWSWNIMKLLTLKDNINAYNKKTEVNTKYV